MKTIEHFFDPVTFTYSYVVADMHQGICVVIDSVLDFDPVSGELSAGSAERIVDYINFHELKVVYYLETHVHADHLSAALYLKKKLGGEIAISHHIDEVQTTFSDVFNNKTDKASEFDVYLKEGDKLKFGRFEVVVLETPGHTPACLTYVIDSTAFVGDTLFMPDYGTARADFPGGDATQLYGSIQKILSLPEMTVLYMCHDYGTDERSRFLNISSVVEQKQHNIHIANTDCSEFVSMREAKDKSLSAPKLLLPSIQFNMYGGRIPDPEANGSSYFKLPIKDSL